MAFTPIDPNKAEVRITGTAPNYGLDFYIPRGERGEIGPVGPVGPISPTNLTVGVVETGPETAGATGPQGLKGDKGDPGGITAATDLNTSDLNLIVTPGIYTQNNSSGVDSPLSNNYPFAGAYGILMVTVTNGTDVIQQFTPQSYAAGRDAKVFYIRNRSNNVWSPWRTFAANRVDQTAGRTIYTWDDVNNREQMIWGDTGWRLVTTPVVAGKVVSGTAMFRRVNENVYLQFVDTVMDTGATGYCTLFTATDVPAGFRPISTERSMQSIGLQANALDQQVISIFGEIAWARVINASVSMTRPSTPLRGTIVWVTNDTWPTTLPGTASGSIPNT